MGAYDAYDHLNPEEKKFVRNHPFDALKIRKDAQKALAEAEKRFGGGSLHNGAGDAFRHCYWNAMMVRDVGRERALAFGNAHESGPNNPPAEKDMDLHNNGVGLDIGAASPNASDGEFASACVAALNDGKLTVIDP